MGHLLHSQETERLYSHDCKDHLRWNSTECCFWMRRHRKQWSRDTASCWDYTDRMSELTRGTRKHETSLLRGVYLASPPAIWCETRSTTQSLGRQTRRLWSLVSSPDPLILSYLQYVTNEEVMRRTTTISPATQVIRDSRLRYFDHVARSGSAEDHCRAVSAALKIHPNQEWKRPPGRPRATWLRTVEKDLALLNLGLHAAWWSAQNRIVNTSTLRQDARHWRRRRRRRLNANYCNRWSRNVRASASVTRRATAFLLIRQMAPLRCGHYYITVATCLFSDCVVFCTVPHCADFVSKDGLLLRLAVRF